MGTLRPILQRSLQARAGPLPRLLLQPATQRAVAHAHLRHVLHGRKEVVAAALENVAGERRASATLPRRCARRGSPGIVPDDQRRAGSAGGRRRRLAFAPARGRCRSHGLCRGRRPGCQRRWRYRIGPRQPDALLIGPGGRPAPLVTHPAQQQERDRHVQRQRQQGSEHPPVRRFDGIGPACLAASSLHSAVLPSVFHCRPCRQDQVPAPTSARDRHAGAAPAMGSDRCGRIPCPIPGTRRGSGTIPAPMHRHGDMK